MVGHDTRAVIITSVPLGAAVVLFADQIARLVISPNEIPVGMVTAIIGAPLMIYLVWRSR
jgi:iron complex transport system permease protein